ncbi:hypothetical protein PT974_06403 [Cladobotryum mycophilum]|uniref:Uncharacterized protein n=1 Tax=Cladobotryum mycophilum TaxID=491253 RepID=A0ABR0SLH3_9HYPO
MLGVKQAREWKRERSEPVPSEPVPIPTAVEGILSSLLSWGGLRRTLRESTVIAAGILPAPRWLFSLGAQRRNLRGKLRGRPRERLRDGTVIAAGILPVSWWLSLDGPQWDRWGCPGSNAFNIGLSAAIAAVARLTSPVHLVHSSPDVGSMLITAK